MFAEERQDVLGLGITPEHRFRKDQLAVEVDVEDAVLARNDLNSIDRFFPLLENARNQTGRVRQRPSGNAVLDPDLTAHTH